MSDAIVSNTRKSEIATIHFFGWKLKDLLDGLGFSRKYYGQLYGEGYSLPEGSEILEVIYDYGYDAEDAVYEDGYLWVGNIYYVTCYRFTHKGHEKVIAFRQGGSGVLYGIMALGKWKDFERQVGKVGEKINHDGLNAWLKTNKVSL